MRNYLSIDSQEMTPYLLLVLIVGLMLTIPYTAMQFTTEVNWDLLDFLVMGLMLTITGSILIFLHRRLDTKQFKLCAVTVLLLFIWLWAELAVGIFTNWGS